MGGGLRTYAAGRKVVDGYRRDEMCPAARGQQLAPWPNRLRGGAYAWDGAVHQLPLDEPEHANAIHGLVRWRPWNLVAHSAHVAKLALRLHPTPGYPFTVDLSVTYALSDGGLSVTTTARNAGRNPCPFAYGAHPYLAVGPRVDSAVVHLPAETYLPTDSTLIPVGRAPVAGTPYDFRSPRPVGRARIDHTFADLGWGPGGRLEVTVTGREGAAVLWAGPQYRYLHLYTGDHPDAGRRRRGLAVEPLTAPPNALATGEGLLRLEPAEEVSMSWGIRPLAAAP